MNKLIVGCLVVGLAGVSQGAFRYWRGSGDLNRPWTDPTNWDDGTKGVPQPGDAVILRSLGKDLVVTDDDAALASSVDYYWDVNSHTVRDSLIWNVSTNASYRGITGDWCGSKGFKTGRFIKRGAGDFNLVEGPSLGTTSYSAPHWVVERGVFRYPQFGTASASGWGGGDMVVSNGATVVLFSAQDRETTTTFSKLVCYGTVTNTASVRVWLGVNSEPSDPSEVYGTIGGNVRFSPGGSINLYSTDSTFTTSRPIGRNGLDPQVIGVMSFGAPDGTPSSLGVDQEINYDYNGPVYRYLGKGETITKNIQTKLHSEYATWNAVHPVSIDGGPYGGLTLENIIYAGPNSGGTELYGMIIEGTNAAPCVYKATQRVFTAPDGNYRSLHTFKRGSGTWEFPYAEGRTLGYKLPYMIGGFSIEEGTIRAEVITDKGQPSSLGAGTDCYGEYIGPYDASKRVSWSISFGTTNALGKAATEGTLEYYGPLKGFSSNREMVLLGDGRIRNASTNTLQMARVSGRTPGEKTITLDGTNALDNVMSEISDGAGTVSVAKEGSGKWILRGNQTFSGDLRVKGGTLEVQASDDYFRYYRLTFLAMPSDFDLYYQIYKFALYDKDGNNLTQNSYLPPPWTDSGDGGSPDGGINTLTREFLELPEPSGNATHGGTRKGYILPGRAGEYKWSSWQSSFSYTWCTSADASNTAGYLQDFSQKAYPTQGQEWSAFPVVIRLRSDLNPVAYYDIVAGGWTKRNPTAFRLEGSRDGVCWYPLDERKDVTQPAYKCWYSDGEAWSASATRTVGGGHAYPVTNNVAVSSLRNFRSVQVAEGATLKTTVGGTKKIDKLTIGADGVGTIDGFQFAESGTVDFTDVPERLKKPLTAHGTFLNDGGTAANFGAWDFTVNGEVDARKAMGYRDGTFTLFPSGSFIMIR